MGTMRVNGGCKRDAVDHVVKREAPAKGMALRGKFGNQRAGRIQGEGAERATAAVLTRGGEPQQKKLRRKKE